MQHVSVEGGITIAPHNMQFQRRNYGIAGHIRNLITLDLGKL